VSDQFGNIDSEYFTVSVDNQFSVTAKNSDVLVEYGEDAALKVDISAKNHDGLTVQWYKESEDGEDELLEGENASSLIVKNVTELCRYYCSVSDQFGNNKSVFFTVSVDNQFSVTAKKSCVFVEYGEDAILQVNISAKNHDGLTIQWYKE
jgi:rRNA processing protein Gar1